MWPYLVIFLSSGFTMTLELVASRLVAPVLGVSLYTWTSVIGVVLAGMSLGSFVGGWMADMWNPRRTLGPMLIVSGIMTALIIAGLPILDMAMPATKSPLVRVVTPITLLFGLPCFTIGLISPQVYRISLRDTQRTGITVGRLSACGTLGSIIGTFATGFYLIPRFGTRTITVAVAAGLVILGLLVHPWRKRTMMIAGLVLALAGGNYMMGLAHATTTDEFIKESAYYRIRVIQSSNPNAEGALRTMVLDNLIHSAASPSNPDYLWYEYERVAAWVIRNIAGNEFRMLCLGGGGYTLPHWVERQYADSQVEVVEIDPEVTKVAMTQFVPDSKRIVTYNEDARTAIKNIDPNRKYDLIFGDAFNDVSVPYHLTTKEFSEQIKARLTPDGIYMANVIDIGGGQFMQAYANTLQVVFGNVTILPGSVASGTEGRSPNLILASTKPLTIEKWSEISDVSFSVKPFRTQPSDLILTDDYAPTDYLLLPVFAKKVIR